MLERIKLGMILFLNQMQTSHLAWMEINKIIDERKVAHLSTLSHIC